MKFKNVQVEDLFFCNSIRLFHFLKANGFYYLYKERINDTNKYSFVFERTKELMGAVTYFTEEKRKYLESQK